MNKENISGLLESVVANTLDGVLIAEATSKTDPTVIYVNEALTKMSGYAKEVLLGRQWDFLHRNSLNYRCLVLMKDAILKKVSCSVEMIDYTKAGLLYYVSVDISPIKDHKGKVTHWISIQRDTTRNMRYIKEIEGENRKLKSIAWIHSDMVMTPLSRMMSLIDLLRNEPSTEGNEALLRKLSKSVADLSKVITGINEDAIKA